MPTTEDMELPIAPLPRYERVWDDVNRSWAYRQIADAPDDLPAAYNAWRLGLRDDPDRARKQSDTYEAFLAGVNFARHR